MPNIIQRISKAYKRSSLGSERNLQRMDDKANWIKFRAGETSKPSYAKGPFTFSEAIYDRDAGLTGSLKEKQDQAKERRVPKISMPRKANRRLNLHE